ncbi:MAG TPA: aquaporin family protein, partial [Gammaproteobacteria bacterium]|nr:aquaporin family protein [Gammaproteobacteria bacterium]
MARNELARRLSAEAIGTAFLLATVVGSGIMGETLSGGNDAVALLGNTVATGAILVVLILVFGGVSGAHFNPAVTMVFLIRGEISGAVALAYIVVQIASALVGTWAAHFMFEEVLMQFSTKPRTGLAQWFSEAVATFGLVMTILGTLRWRPDRVSYA